jgi:hypothetical protein
MRSNGDVTIAQNVICLWYDGTAQDAAIDAARRGTSRVLWSILSGSKCIYGEIIGASPRSYGGVVV